MVQPFYCKRSISVRNLFDKSFLISYIINIIKINKEGNLIKDYSKINSMWDVLVNDIDEVADKIDGNLKSRDSVKKSKSAV